ncbi:hypothetical protein B0H10DRAFT_1940363 [Mycena sp. CBHHK59/15]|nr:hypothetical protein B0H10DRAFT_1940363 [Mycena sp. CBHHK59/15]
MPLATRRAQQAGTLLKYYIQNHKGRQQCALLRQCSVSRARRANPNLWNEMKRGERWDSGFPLNTHWPIPFGVCLLSVQPAAFWKCMAAQEILQAMPFSFAPQCQNPMVRAPTTALALDQLKTALKFVACLGDGALNVPGLRTVAGTAVEIIEITEIRSLGFNTLPNSIKTLLEMQKQQYRVLSDIKWRPNNDFIVNEDSGFQTVETDQLRIFLSHEVILFFSLGITANGKVICALITICGVAFDSPFVPTLYRWLQRVAFGAAGAWLCCASSTRINMHLKWPPDPKSMHNWTSINKKALPKLVPCQQDKWPEEKFHISKVTIEKLKSILLDKNHGFTTNEPPPISTHPPKSTGQTDAMQVETPSFYLNHIS